MITCGSSLSGSFEVCTDVGQISLDNAAIGGDVLIDTDSADVILNTIDAGGAVGITSDTTSDTGTITLTDVKCQSLTASVDTGDILLKNVTAKDAFSIEGDVCDVKSEDCDAGTLDVKTDTGDITGTLLSDKVFITKTLIGVIDVPKSTAGGECEITTDTGDIKIRING